LSNHVQSTDDNENMNF